jgi:hypothetical protein
MSSDHLSDFAADVKESLHQFPVLLLVRCKLLDLSIFEMIIAGQSTTAWVSVTTSEQLPKVDM